MERDYWTEMISNIIADINTSESIIDLLGRIWIGSRDEEFNNLMRDAQRSNGAIMAYLLRKKIEAEHSRDNPPAPRPDIHFPNLGEFPPKK